MQIARRNKKGMVLLILVLVAVVLVVGPKLFFNREATHFEQTHRPDLELQPIAAIEHCVLIDQGVEIHYFVAGNPHGELLIFLHPAFSDHHAFDAQIDAFAHHYRIITVDMVGHGASQGDRSGVKIDQTPHHIWGIMQQEGAQHAHLVGVSMGGLLAQYFEFLYPDRTLSLTLLGAYNIHKKSNEVNRSQAATQLSMVARALYSMSAFRARAALLSTYTTAAQWQFYCSASGYTFRSFGVMSTLSKVIDKRSHQIKCPVLVLCAQYDLPLAIRMGEALHQELPQSDYLLIPGAGHCANMDAAELFNAKLSDFLTAQAPGNAH